MTRNFDPNAGPTRRTFLKGAVVAAGIIGPADRHHTASGAPDELPWYRRTLRWGQTNITEADPAVYDVAWWRAYWRRTRVQGVIINAGGIVAYYPSDVPHHHRAETLGHRDLYGELARAAHEDGLAVFARMDSNRAHEPLYHAHHDWFAVDRSGKPYRAADLYVTCINSPYYDEYIPRILREIIGRSHPEGITDNSWSGLDRESPCYCANCERRFRERTGKALPARKDWDAPLYREWVLWNYDRRLEVWDRNNRVTREAGGPHCLWVGMNSGSVTSQAALFRDLAAIAGRAEILMLDHQARDNAGGFQENGDTGKRVHSVLGWDKLAPESMAMYQAGRPVFRRASKPEPEARLWVLEGFAGGIQPWWHHIGAAQEDRRQFHTIVPLNQWHEQNQEYLVERRPVATVAVAWSQRNTDFYGRDDPDLMVDLPYRGVVNALIRARIPYLPIHIDHLERGGVEQTVLILPELAAMSDSQCAAVHRFVEQGGHAIATGRTGLYTEQGEPRLGDPLSDLLGVQRTRWKPSIPERLGRARETVHTYLRVVPERRRHPVLAGFEETDILPFGGRLEGLQPARGAEVLLTYVPPFPVYPPETAWMRTSRTDVPGLIVRTTDRGSRIAYLAADLDRRFGRDNLPDHAALLANLVRWAAGDAIPLLVDGPGLVDCHLHRQPGRMILHLVNLTSAGTWRAPVYELISVGPFKVRVRLDAGVAGRTLKRLVARRDEGITPRDGWVSFDVPSLLDHEVVVIA